MVKSQDSNRESLAERVLMIDHTGFVQEILGTNPVPEIVTLHVKSRTHIIYLPTKLLN